MVGFDGYLVNCQYFTLQSILKNMYKIVSTERQGNNIKVAFGGQTSYWFLNIKQENMCKLTKIRFKIDFR